jgi:signal transduction histidine kinase
VTVSARPLVVAADEAQRARWSSALEPWGQVRTAGDASAALAAIREATPDCALLVADLSDDDLLAVVEALPDPRCVCALVPPGRPDTHTRLAQAGVVAHLPADAPDSAVRAVLAELRAREVEGARMRELLAAVARARHEVNNPLTSILAETQLLLLDASDLPGEVERSVRTIQAMAKRIRDVMRELQKWKAAS